MRNGIPCKLLLILALLAFGWSVADLRAQDAPQQPPSGSSQNPNKQDAPADAGGPTGDVGPYAIPKKKDEPPPPPPPEKAKKIEGMPDYSIHVDVPLVNVDVMVTTKDGQFIPGLQKGNFKILEDGVRQNVTNFNTSEAPITAVLLAELASPSYPLMVG